jgi:hypothetical protein
MNIFQQPAVYAPVIPACASFFIELGKVCWDFFGRSGADPLLVGLTAVRSDAVYKSLKRRLMLVRLYRNEQEIHSIQQELYRIMLANGSTEVQAKEVSGGKFVLVPFTKDKVASRDDVQWMKSIKECCAVLDGMSLWRGSRWNALVDAVDSQEVLLIDEYDEDLWHEGCPNHRGWVGRRLPAVQGTTAIP